MRIDRLLIVAMFRDLIGYITRATRLSWQQDCQNSAPASI